MSSIRLFLLYIDNCLKCSFWRLLMQLAVKSSPMTSSSTFSDDIIATRFFLCCCSIRRIPSSVECENIDKELQDSKTLNRTISWQSNTMACNYNNILHVCEFSIVIICRLVCTWIVLLLLLNCVIIGYLKTM